MKLSELAVKRPVTVIMLVLIVLILGFVSLTGIPLDLIPEINLPVAIVMTTYSGVGPQEIESLITKPIEDAVGTVANIETLQSISQENISIVVMQFDFNADLDKAMMDVRDRVDMMEATLPEDASAPTVAKIDLSAMPMMMVSVSTENLTQLELQALMEDVIQPGLERVEGVASVETFGSISNVVEVLVDDEKLRGYNLTLDYLAGIIRAENLDVPAGTVQRGEQSLTVTTVGQFDAVEQIAEMLIPLPTGAVLRLNDLATVTLKPEDVTTISRANGQPSVDVMITKQSGGNTVNVSKAVREQIAALLEEIPRGGKINILYDSADYIRQSLSQVATSALEGCLLAMIILFIFLRNVRTTLIIGISIPTSIIATFCLLYFADVTLNMMTLGGLALGVGMLVDNSIVVLENVYRHRQNGLQRSDAAIKGAEEVSMALVASTLTTVAVFVPIFFATGIAPMLFGQLAMTVSFSLMASLVVAITLVPMLCSKMMKVSPRKEIDEFHELVRAEAGGLYDWDHGENGKSPTLLGRLHSASDHVLEGLNKSYAGMLRWAVAHRKSVLGIATLALIICVSSVVAIGQEFFPSTDQGFLMVDAELADGSTVEETAVSLALVEAAMAEIPEIANVYLEAGSSGGLSAGGENTGLLYIELTPIGERERGDKEVMEDLRNLVKDIPGAEFSVSSMSAMSLGSTSSLSVSVYGDDLETLRGIADDFVGIVRGIEGTREVASSYADGIPKVRIAVNRERSTLFGLTASQVGQSVRTVISGMTATQLRTQGTEIPVVIKGDDFFKENLAALGQIPVGTGGQLTLEQLADITIVRGPVSINRVDKETTLTVSADISGRDLGSVSTEVEQALNLYNLPDGYHFDMSGMTETMNDAFSDLFMMLGLAIVLVYMVMAAQFESLLHPFIIMFSLPLGLAGGIFGLFVAGIPLSVPGLIGEVMLAGIVVNNAIVLVDYVNTRRRVLKEDKMTALLKAGPIRLRPILMTTLTTVLGMLPMGLGIGSGAEMTQPLALVVIFGLSLSTLVTLIVIPVLYLILDNFGEKFSKQTA